MAQGNEVFNVTIGANMDIGGVLGAVKQMQSAFSGLKLPQSISADMIKDFNKLQESLKKFDTIAKQDHFSKTDLKSLDKLQKEIDSTFSKLTNSFNEIKGQSFYLDADYTAIKNAQAEVDKLKNDIKSKLSEVKIDFKAAGGGTKSLGLDEMIQGMERGVKSSKVLSAAMAEVKQSFQTGNFGDASAQLSDIVNKATTLKGAGAGLLTVFKQWGLIDFSKPASDLAKTKEGTRLLASGLEKILPAASADSAAIKKLAEDLTAASNEKRRLEQVGQNNIAKMANEGAGAMDRLSAAERQAAGESKQLASSVLDATTQVKQLQQSTQYFFSLRNMINLLKRGVKEAIQTVKELDAAMTETAVVTKFDVGDMWAKLPEYTANANALGATVQDMYEATTLYYQQGLNAEQAMSIASETMKMARIGGLEAADATDKMTAALRGFNMELTQASAQRVNDVYSNLAAKTASNTEELGTAMQRTASIAASAGMSFEGTAAFLAQAIETTREPAENLGTAMKTIVARFQELKENPLEIAEVDGEEVSYNKVDTALQSIGVSLKDTNGQFRDLDKVFLEISQKWNSLTQTQQRYIATTAAGSRQQSRFIAMMSNYERTQELMSYANDSSGASNEQFGKTLESLEAKLAQLQNAWKGFLMNIMNDSWTKGIVDAGTKVLDTVNSIINALSLGGKAKGIKSFLSLFTAFTALKMTGRLANRMIGGLGGLVDPTSSFGQGFRSAAYRQTNPTTQARAISQPIVGVLQRISGQIAAIATKQGIRQPSTSSNNEIRETTKAAYAQARADLNKLSQQKSFTMGEASKIFGGLDEKHQRSLFMNNPGTRMAMKQASFQWIDSKKMSPELTKQGRQYINAIYQGMEKGQISVDKGMKLIGRPDLWGEHFATDTAKAFSKQFQADSEKAGRAAQIGAWRQLGMKGASDEAKKAFLADQKNVEQYNKLVAKNYDKAMQGMSGHQASKGTVSNMGRFANDIGAVGDRFTQAGYGISAFGSLLAQLGGPIGMVGTGLQSLGGIVSSLGMSVSGMTSLFSLFTVGLTDATGAVVVAGSTIASVVAPLAALGVAFVLARQHFKKIKEAGEEVTKTFTEQNKKAEDNIAKLKSYQGELAQLSKGVDSHGNNVSLNDEQYQRYLEIVDDIATINPEIVEGYNAQGHAIINNNTALAETLKKQEEIHKKVLDTYTDEESLQKLIDARNINKDYKNIQIQENGVSLGYGHGNEGRSASNGIGKAIPLAGDVSSIADKLRLLKGFDPASLEKYGIESLDSLLNGEEQAVKNFIKHREQIQADLSNSGIELNKGILKGFEKLGENKEAFDEAIKPVYDNLLTQASQSPLYDSIAEEFRGALNTGLQDLAGQDLSASEMSKATNNMVARFANLTTGSGKYADALKIAEDAQSKFADSLDETKYRADVQPAIDDLITLKEEALNEGTAYGDALAEYLDNQIQHITNFTKEGGLSLTEALNTATDEIAAAESALENFNKATEKDYSTAAEGMKSILDKTTETFKDSYGTEIQKHAEGMGDVTFWTGADALLGEETVDKIVEDAENGYEAAEKVSSALKDLEPSLRDGQEGFDAFTDRVLAHSDALDKLEGVEYDKESGLLTKVPDEQWHNVAEALEVSDDTLAAMISKGRQFADISFMNIEEARKGLATSDFTIKGTSAKEGEQQKLYVKEDTLRAELANAGYVRRDQQDDQIEVLKDQNVDILKSAESYEKGSQELADKFNDMGVKTLPDLIQTLNDTGDFTKDEIQAYADKLGLLGDESRFDSLYSDIIEAAENPELVKQTGVLETISAQVAALMDTRTGSEALDDYKKAHKELVGGEGVDTEAQAFAFGKKLDENGNLVDLSAGEFEQTSKSLREVSDNYKEAAAIAAAHAKTATGQEKERWETIQKGYEEDAERIDRYLDKGAEAFNKHQEELEKEAEAKKSKDEGKKQERDASKEAQQNAEKKQKELEAEKAGRQAQEEAKKKMQPISEKEAAQARQEGREQEQLLPYQRDLEQRRKGREQELSDAEKANKELNEAKAEEAAGRREENAARDEAKKKTQEEAKARENAGRQLENEARDKAKQQEQDQAARREKEFQGEAKEAAGREQAKQITAEANTEDVQKKIDHLVNKNINTSLKTALDNLDASTVAQDPAQTQALSNVYKDLLNDRLPNAEDLEQLDILGDLDSSFLEQVLTDKGVELETALQTGIDNLGNSINGVTAPEITPTINEGTNLVSGVAEQAVAATLGVDTSEADAKIAETQAKVQEAATQINQGATFKINVPGVKDLTKAETAANNLAKKAGTQTIGVKTGKVDTGSVKTATSSIKSTQADIKVGANTETAYSRVNQLLSSVQGRSAYIDIEAHVRKTGINSITIDGKTVNVRASASGMNNYIPHTSVPSFGSAAKGRYGTVGPKDKGGLTLTGEKGFEIAWIPSENRSMILGVGGPQMLNLPSDAVVFTHEQSKDILKRKSIPAGSHADETARNYQKKYSSTDTSNNNNNNNNNGNGGKDKKTQDKEKENVDNAAKVIAKAGWVQVWWENMTRRIEATQKKVDNSASTFDKLIKRFGTTVTSIQSTVNGYRTNLKHSIALNKNEVTQAKYELKQLTNPNSWYNKKEVSYEEKTGDKSESKKMTVKLANYIKYNSKEGTYEIRQDMLDKIGLKGWTDGKGNKHPANQGLAQAIKDAAEKEINDRNSKLKTAEDNIKKAEEALEKLNNDVYETFYRWEKSINKVYLLSQKLEILNKQLAISSSKSELQFSKLTAGVTNAAGAMSRITSALNNQRTTLLSKANTTAENLKAAKSEFQNSLTITPYASNYLKNPDSTNARNDFIAARKAFAFLDKVNLSGDNFNYQDALNYLNQAGMSKDEYDAIKGVLDKIFEKQNNYLQAQEDSFKSIDEIYQTMSEYESFIADFEADLLSGMEEQAENQINHLDKLNSSLSKAFKDLIDEVKNKLDERRKKEDNQKTESELAQKQQRLSMLRADTSGGHAVEIAQLEKEIAEGQQSYQRTLEDQLIEKLQQQGDAAEKQRQQQIELLTIQNQVARETGSNLAQVKEWLKNPQANYENIRAAWLANQNYDEVPEGTREKLEHDFEEAFARYQGYGVQIEKYDEMIDELSKLENSVDEIATNITTDRPTYTAKDLKDKGYKIGQLKKLEYSAASLRQAGFSNQEIKDAGYTAAQFAAEFKQIINDKDSSKSEKYSAMRKGISTMHQVGYSNNDIAKQFGVLNTMQYLDAGGKTIQDALGKNNNATIKKVQEWINAKDKNGNKKYSNLKQTDLAGMKADVTINGKKLTGTVTAGGKHVYVNDGSTLHGVALDNNGSINMKTLKSVPIDKLTTAHFKSNKKEATEALVYAIQHQIPGTLINKNFLALAKAAGIVGKEYQIDTGSYKVMATVGGDGNIFYNVKDGVQVWNPAKSGVNWLDKYNEARFKKMAKTTAGREYKQVLRDKKVKGYATGGLADYTGPAWLDGTPAKPELILNAQDTKNFIALKDVLSRAIGSTSAISNEYGGDTTYEININVDHLNNDYDVDKVAERVKKIIVKDSSYRNVTQVRKFR